MKKTDLQIESFFFRQALEHGCKLWNPAHFTRTACLIWDRPFFYTLL